MEYKNLSELLKEREELLKEYEIISYEMEEGSEKEYLLTHISLALDCIECNLMYGDFINDTGQKYDYWNEG